MAGGTVYVGSGDSKVYALDAATGRPRWTYTTGGPVFAGPAVAGGTVYVGSYEDRKVYALDAATGRPRWTYTTESLAWRSPRPAASARHRLRRQQGPQGVRAGRRVVSIRRGVPRKVGAVYQFPHIDPRHRLEARP